MALDRLDLALLARLVERDRAAAAPDPAGPTDPVHVDVGRYRDVEVDDVRDADDVEPAGCDVGRDQQRQPPVLEGDHHAVARALSHVPVQRLDVHPAVAQRPVQLIAADLRPHEHERLLRALGLEHLDESVRLLAGLDLERELLDRVDRQRRGLDLDQDRVVQVLVGEPADLRRHRRGEQRRLATRRRQRQDPLDVFQEPEVEHLVSLVEHDEAARVQHQRMARDQVLDTSDGPDDHVTTGAQLRLLGADRGAAEHRDDVDPLAVAVRAQSLRDLDAQFAGRCQHEALHLVLGGIDVLQHRQPERRGLARSRLRLTDHVRACEQRRDRLLLNRARRLVADVPDRVEDVRTQAEIGKSCHLTITIDGRRGCRS